jgi:hypothetical protein
MLSHNTLILPPSAFSFLFPSTLTLLPQAFYPASAEGVGTRGSPIKTFLHTMFLSAIVVVHKPRSGFVLILHLREDHWFNNNGYHGGLGYLHTWSFLIALFLP